MPRKLRRPRNTAEWLSARRATADYARLTRFIWKRDNRGKAHPADLMRELIAQGIRN